MSTQGSDLPGDEPAIVWWPWWVLATGPALAAVLATIDDEPADGGGSLLGFVIVALLAVLFLALVFAPSLLLISRNAQTPLPTRRRAGLVFVAGVAGAHVVGQVIDRLGPDDGDSSVWALVFIGTYVAASAISWFAMGRIYRRSAT